MAGRPPDVSDGEILDLFQSAEENQLTTSDMKAKLGYTQSGANRCLRTLEEDGHLKSRSVENNTLWRLSDD